VRLSEEELNILLKKGHAKIRSDSSVSTSGMELPARNKQVEKKKSARFTSSVNIRVHSIRKRLTDPDGTSAKAVIDGIVKAGILLDDGPKQIKEVRFTQEKGKEEKTIITIQAV
jgi:Holliday junction resolvase RusA-like endonuclease